MFLPRLFCVERSHVRVAPTKDRHELRFRCAVLSRDAGTSLAQSVSRTIFEPGGIAPFPHAIAKSGRREGLAVRGHKKRQVAARLVEKLKKAMGY